MRQKLVYMHENSCKDKWNLAVAPVDYKHSSAKYYITGEQGIYKVFNYCGLADINLTEPLEKNSESTQHTRTGSETSATKQ